MRDWSEYVRRNLRLPHHEPEREAEIVEDLAEQLGEAYAEALERGLSHLRIPTKAITHSDLIPITDSRRCRSPSERSDAGGRILTEVIGIRQRMRWGEVEPERV